MKWFFVGLILFIGLMLILVATNTCVDEDSIMCIWNAKEQGNGIGKSFITFWPGFTIFVGA